MTRRTSSSRSRPTICSPSTTATACAGASSSVDVALEIVVRSDCQRGAVGEITRARDHRGLSDRRDVDHADIASRARDREHSLAVPAHELAELRGADRRVDGGRQHEHHVAHASAGEANMRQGRRLLGIGTEIYEYADDGEHEVRHHPNGDQHEREPAAGGAGDVGGALEVESSLEQRAKDASTVEREGGDQVERGEHQVQPREAGKERTAHQVDRVQRHRRDNRGGGSRDAERDARDGTGDGHRELVARRRGKGLEPRDTSDRQRSISWTTRP